MAKHSVSVYKSGDSIYIKGQDLLIVLPLDTEKVLAVYYGEKVETELELQLKKSPKK